MTSIVHHRHDRLEGTDADGNIVTGARRDAIPREFWPVIEQAIEEAMRFEHGSSLYVYGSVATGMAHVGSSDVDLVTIGVDAADARHLASVLSATHRGLCRGVEVGPAQLVDYEGRDDEAYGNRVFLRHYCAHLAGPDPASALPRYPADKAAARGFNGDIGLRTTQWRTELGQLDSAALARQMARKTLFAVAGLVSTHDAQWTTDRLSSARRWSEIRPESAEAMQTLVSWGFGSPVHPPESEVRKALDGVVAEIVAEFEARIGLWRPASCSHAVGPK